MPAWTTPELWPGWWVASCGAVSRTVRLRPGWRCRSSRASARPRMPPPTTARSVVEGGTGGARVPPLMILEETPLGGAYLVKPERFEDERGWFARIFHDEAFAELGMDPAVSMTNLSYNTRAGTLRG